MHRICGISFCSCYSPSHSLPHRIASTASTLPAPNYSTHIERVRVYDAFSAVVFKVRDDFTEPSDENENFLFQVASPMTAQIIFMHSMPSSSVSMYPGATLQPQPKVDCV